MSESQPIADALRKELRATQMAIPNCVGWSPASSGSVKWGYATAVDGLTPQNAAEQ